MTFGDSSNPEINGLKAEENTARSGKTNSEKRWLLLKCLLPGGLVVPQPGLE